MAVFAPLLQEQRSEQQMQINTLFTSTNAHNSRSMHSGQFWFGHFLLPISLQNTIIRLTASLKPEIVRVLISDAVIVANAATGADSSASSSSIIRTIMFVLWRC
jgi:hypothetical protein